MTAPAQFWADTDQVTPFWETIEEAELLAGITKSELRKRYETWCEVEGARPFNRVLWARACKSYGLETSKIVGGARFVAFSDEKRRILNRLGAQGAQLSTFSNVTREESILPRIQFENNASCAPCAPNGKSETELEEVEL
jgi:hypothetical protein